MSGGLSLRATYSGRLYVFDLWAQWWRENHAAGAVIVVRYADDAVVGFQHRGDAERFHRELAQRMEKFGLALHPEKTRLIELPVQGAWLRRVVLGYFNSHAVPGNSEALKAFRTQVIRHWRKALKRRSPRHRLPWRRFGPPANRWLPKAQLLHPSPHVRFFARHPR